ncbi:hypothetical protein [Clostridium magnum]|uniref:PAS fold-4 domain-containing protein n=1 Tax=Clostridium magnum DSM 2767 TaxID=1121326 RepID=A0A161X3V1_9CLOT|nr:hypothetical protein [Clostridium magnum]KZL88486.1 hypothetical protein CLMAG_62580 [Clostridium magnum DSM 2767]SHI89565.1 hypothetical protein SAMN02745944_05017 [Clostridium magnum DSM 2767]
MIDEKVIEAFHIMWDSFPAPVRLIHKNKTVLAVNETAQSMGMKTEVPCFAIGTPEAHKGCMANEAITSNKAQVQHVGSEKIKYWLPVKDYPDVYVHYTITIDSAK